MSRQADASQCGGVVVEFQSNDIRDARANRTRNIPGELYFSQTRNRVVCLSQARVLIKF